MGVIRKANPTAGDVHVDRPLTNVSVAWIQDDSEYIANRVFPVVPVNKQSNVYFTYSRADWLRSEAKKRAPATESAGGGWSQSTDNYFADIWALHKDVSDPERDNADPPLDPDQDATAYVTQQVLIAKDVDWAASFFVTGLWTTERAGVASGPTGTQFLRWDDASSTPIEDVTEGVIAVKALTGMKPNILVLHPLVYNALRNHADIKDVVKHTQLGVLTPQLLAQLFDVDEVLIAWAVVNTGPEGGTESTDFIVGKHALLCYRTRIVSPRVPTAGYTFAWTGMAGAGAFGNRIKKFRVEEKASDRVEIEAAFAQKLVSADLGAFFLDAVS